MAERRFSWSVVYALELSQNTVDAITASARQPPMAFLRRFSVQ